MSENDELEFETPLEEEVDSIDVPSNERKIYAEAERYQNISKSDEQELRTAFKNTCQIIRSMFGKNAFKRFQTKITFIETSTLFEKRLFI